MCAVCFLCILKCVYTHVHLMCMHTHTHTHIAVWSGKNYSAALIGLFIEHFLENKLAGSIDQIVNVYNLWPNFTSKNLTYRNLCPFLKACIHCNLFIVLKIWTQPKCSSVHVCTKYSKRNFKLLVEKKGTTQTVLKRNFSLFLWILRWYTGITC